MGKLFDCTPSDVVRRFICRYMIAAVSSDITIPPNGRQRLGTMQARARQSRRASMVARFSTAEHLKCTTMLDRGILEDTIFLLGIYIDPSRQDGCKQ